MSDGEAENDANSNDESATVPARESSPEDAHGQVRVKVYQLFFLSTVVQQFFFIQCRYRILKRKRPLCIESMSRRCTTQIDDCDLS